ncbi:thioredoxin family protein [Acidianus brierleyi]|uniref:Thioredoxin n=1 Tax=Acidianus brierleyi TaxID=41673 RepID=A0A2U9IHS9_9CREN|nr:thioredoxin domain-containing protein [Acidianus brierleyi]AWR95570.1 thioredoxin [Acidianus brierleyi]
MKFKKWRDVINEGTPLKLLYFYTDWCEYCEKQKEILDKIPDWDSFSYAEINADERPDLAIRYSPQIYPSISIITENNVVGGLYGYNDSQQIEETMLIALDLYNGGGKLFSEKNLKNVSKRTYNVTDAIDLIKRNCLAFFDIYYGGFEREPKYYLPNVLRFLLRDKKDPYSLEVVKYTVDAVIYNLWNEGFYAYAKKYDWSEPSKEKLLDINAEMVITLLETYERTKDDYYLGYAIETGKWILKNRDREFYPIAVGENKGGYYMPVNSEIGEMFYLLYKYSNISKFLEESTRLAKILPEKLSHNLESDSPLFLIDMAYLLRFLSSMGKGIELIPKIKDLFYGGDAFFDVPLSLAREEKIGRFKLLTDNSVLAQALLKLGVVNEATKIANFFLKSFYNYTYFSQAEYGMLLAMLNENV